MVGFLIIVNIVFLIAYSSYIGNKKIKYGRLVSKKQKQIFNIIVFIIFITYVFLQTYLIYTAQPTTVTLEQLRENEDSVTTAGGRLFEAVMWLVFSPVFWISLFHLYKEITENFFKRRYINSNGKTDYYRDTLQNISPAIASFVLENSINVSKALTADILKLELEGYIIEEEDTLKCSNLNKSNLSKSEQLLMKAIKTNVFSDKEYMEAVEQETLELKLLSKHKTKLKKAIKIALNTIPRVFILLILIGIMTVLTFVDQNLIKGVLVFTKDDFSTPYGEDSNYYKARYIKIDEEMYKQLKEKREEEIEKLVEKELEKEEKNKSETDSTVSNNSTFNFPKFNISHDTQASLKKSSYTMKDLKEQLFFTNTLGDHYVKASYVSVGVISLDTLITIVQTALTILLFISIASVANIIRFIIVSVKYSNNYILTNKGMKLRKEIKGLKKYLKEYSLIKTRTKEEVIIWEYYLIYAIVLHENVKVENNLIKKFVKQIYTKK